MTTKHNPKAIGALEAEMNRRSIAAASAARAPITLPSVGAWSKGAGREGKPTRDAIRAKRAKA